MKMKMFALILALILLSVILASIHFINALQGQTSTPSMSASPDPEVPAVTAMPPLALTAAANLTLPDMNQSSFDIPDMKMPDIGIIRIDTPTPTPERPCPTPMQPMQPMQPMDPWKPVAAMTPMLA